MKETLVRALSGVLYIILLLGCIQYSQQSFFGLLLVFLVIAVYELSKLFKISYWLPVIISLFIYWCFFGKDFEPIKDGVLNAISIVTLVGLIMYLFSKQNVELPNWSKYLIIVGYLIIPFILMNKISIGVKGYNPKIITSIFIIIWTNDTFAYLVGKQIGKNKLFEKVSPKKTIEGFVGGLFFGLLAGILLSKYYIGGALLFWIYISIIVVIFGTLGDLVESKFKRVAQMKDSGKIMPGHGGILDRLDSVIFATPFVFLLYQIMYYVS
ncbi:MAG: phosphatidate cytidylyltransferase [Flavobacterium sp.]